MSPRLFLPVLALVLPACHTSGTLFTHGCLTTTDRATCTFAASATAPLQRQGTIDAAYTQVYTCTALVEGMDLDGPVTLDQAEVAILDPAQGNVALAEFSVPITAPIEPSAPLATADVTLIDAATMRLEASRVIASSQQQTVVVHFVVTGHNASGTLLAAPSIEYPIDITDGSSCANSGGEPCISNTANTVSPDCRLGVDEPTGTSCSTIASQIGACRFLECDMDPSGASIIETAHCPTHVPADQSCCHP